MKNSEEKIMTQHPQGKKGVNILKHRYDTVADYIMKTLGQHPNITYNELNQKANSDLSGTFDGKVSWYVVTVKLDLEARGKIERVPKTSPHQLRLKG
jgi:hypothetical protein